MSAFPTEPTVVAYKSGDPILSLGLKVGDEVDVTFHGATLCEATTDAVTVMLDDRDIVVPLALTGLTIEPLLTEPPTTRTEYAVRYTHHTEGPVVTDPGADRDEAMRYLGYVIAQGKSEAELVTRTVIETAWVGDPAAEQLNPFKAEQDRLGGLADPDCERCEGSGLDPDCYTFRERADGRTIYYLTEPCRDCIGEAQ